MKKEVLILILLLIIPFSIAEENWHEYSKLTIDFSVTNNLGLIREGPNYYVTFVNASVFWFPKEDYRQKILSINTTPPLRSNEFVFHWKYPLDQTLSYEINSILLSSSDPLQVSNKKIFPLTNFDLEFSEYTKPADIIDITPEIRQLASSLAEGEDDLFELEFKLGEWIRNNIEYSLSTITAEASQQASWVLKNKVGVCDEITSLFISMNRALGIPAKYVSGLAYSTSSEFTEKWGGHGWAEVYFPEIGWVPFDITYGQYGFLDATHIKLTESKDSSASSAVYLYEGRDFSFDTGSMDVNINIKQAHEKNQNKILIDAEYAKSLVGFNSYNLLTITVKNLMNYYVAPTLQISRAMEMAIDGEPKFTILLTPKETQKIYFLTHIKEPLKSRRYYIFPTTVYSDMGKNISTSFNVREDYPDYQKQVFESFINQKKNELEKPYSKYVNLECQNDNSEYYSNEILKTDCKLANAGNYDIKRGDMCFDGECTKIEIAKGQVLSFNYTKNLDVIGSQIAIAKFTSSQAVKSSYLSYDVLDKPVLNIINLTAPEQTEFSEVFNISFVIDKLSKSRAINIRTRIQHLFFEQKWMTHNMTQPRSFKLIVPAKHLKHGRNKIEILVEYEDLRHNKYYDEEIIYLDLYTDDIFEKAYLLLNYVAMTIEKQLDKIFK